jgi:hypothetical protein
MKPPPALELLLGEEFQPFKGERRVDSGIGFGLFTGGGFAGECYLFDASWHVLVAIFSFV